MYASLTTTLLTAAALLAADQPACQARLELQRSGENLTVTGHCRNVASAAGRWAYELRTEKKGRSGSASNSQAGRFVAGPGQDVVLSRTTLNLGLHDVCRVQLRVLDEHGAVLAADSLLLPAAP
jgi:hypothetical protein